MSSLDAKNDQLRVTPIEAFDQMAFVWTVWKRLRFYTRVNDEHRILSRKLRKHFNALCDAKCRLMKRTGISETEHSNLEAAIVHLARALEDYRDRRVRTQ